MLFITVYALIGDDIRILSTDKDADIVFTVLNIMALTLFAVELILSSIGVKDYFGSFFFWLDLISTISIVLDIEPVANGLLGQGNEEIYNMLDTHDISSICNGNTAAKISAIGGNSNAASQKSW